MYLRIYTSIIYTKDEENVMGFTAEISPNTKLNRTNITSHLLDSDSYPIRVKESLTKNRVFASLKTRGDYLQYFSTN